MIEVVSDAVHESWSRWMAYLFTKGDHHPDGSFTIDPESVKHWKRQVETSYKELSESEKESDRKEARIYLKVME